MNTRLAAPLPPGQSELHSDMHPDERAARLQLAACYRVFAMLGWTEMIYNHITVRLPESVSRGEKQFLINPFGLHYSEVTAGNLVKIDLDGNKLDDNPHPVNPAGFVIHSAVHAARHDIQCVMHTHTLNGVGVSAQKRGILPISQQSIFVLADLGYHDYEGVALRDDEKPRLVADLGDKIYLMLRNRPRRCTSPGRRRGSSAPR